MSDFNLWMSSLHSKARSWLDVYDFSKHCERVSDEDVVFVDVAGGIGQQCALLKQEMPEVKGRVILQDLEMAIQHSIPIEGAEKSVIDMWEGQSVRGTFLPLCPSLVCTTH
jgi:demethylsterigmatocystin 6-O-methyltransferase